MKATVGKIHFYLTGQPFAKSSSSSQTYTPESDTVAYGLVVFSKEHSSVCLDAPIESQFKLIVLRTEG